MDQLHVGEAPADIPGDSTSLEVVQSKNSRGTLPTRFKFTLFATS